MFYYNNLRKMIRYSCFSGWWEPCNFNAHYSKRAQYDHTVWPYI